MMSHPKEPTADECDAKSRLPDFGSDKAYAIWYPQMGGYVSKAVVVFCDDGCFGAYVWHDGDFPFSDESPTYLHHCCAEKFIEFGKSVKDMQETKEN